eukprot:528596_1
MSNDNAAYLLVIGFIREIEQIVDKHFITISSLDIHKLCFNFYFIVIPFRSLIRTDGDSATIINHKTKTFATISKPDPNNIFYKHQDDDYAESQWIHIPNISSSIHNFNEYNNKQTTLEMDKNKDYDGIMGICNYSALNPFAEDSQHSFLFFVESHKILSNEKHIQYQSIELMGAIEDDLPDHFPSNIIYTTPDNGVVYEWIGSIYQCKLQDINNIKFNKIQNQNTNKTFDNLMYSSDYKIMFADENWNGSVDWLELNHLGGDKIFGMECHHFLNLDCDVNAAKLYNASQCGIFDIVGSKWIKCNDYPINYIHTFDVSICKNNQMNSNNNLNIYIVTMDGYTSQLDLHKNQWRHIVHKDEQIEKMFENTPKHKAMLYLDDNNINIMYCQCYGWMNYDKKYFGFLDLRDKQKKWNEIQNHFDFINAKQDNDFMNSWVQFD